MLDDEQRCRMLDEIIALTTVPPIAPEEWTVREYMARAGVAEHTARRQLDRLVDRGTLSKRKVIGREGRRVAAYRKLETED